MVNPLRISVTSVLRDGVTPQMKKSLRAIRQANSKTFQAMNKQTQKARKGFRNLKNEINATAASLNATLGGRIKNAAGQMNNLGQNISSISNRLGFMAFQWNFMGNAAQRAVQIVLGGLTSIITEGAQMSDALTRALAFATDISGLRRNTDAAKAEIEGLRDAIFAEGSGKNIFGIDQISNVAKELAKAFPETIGTEGVKTVLPFVAQLKTLEPQLSDEKIGSGLVSLFATLGTNTKDVNEVAAAMDFLSNVSDKSTANFQSSIASLGIASQQAKAIGITAFETGAIIQQVSDVLARNVGGGRASATAGRFANIFFADLNKIADAESKQGEFARFVNLDIFETVDGKKQFKDLVGITEVFRTQLASRSTADRASFLSQLGLSENSQKTLNALLTKTGEELREQIELLKERGTLEARAAATATSAQSQILRIQAAINSLKVTISDGFAPALFEIANQMQEIAGAKEFRILMADIGKIMSNFLIPTIKTALKFIKVFLGFLSKNKKTLKLVIAGVLALTAALVGLQIIATVGFFALVAGASIAGMTGQMFLAAGAASALRAGITLLFRSFIPMAIAGLGVALIALSLTEIFDKDLQPAIFGIGVALSALGAAILFPTQSLGLFKSALGLIPAAISRVAIASTAGTAGFKLLGQDMAKAFTGAFDRSTKTAINTPNHAAGGGLLKLLKKNKLPVIGIAIAIGAAFALWLNNAIQTSPIFQGGLTDYWEEAGIQLKAAVFKTARAIGRVFEKIAGFIVDIFKNIAETAGRVLGKVFEFLSDPFNPVKLKALQDTINQIFDPKGIETFFAEFADPDLEAINELTARFKRLREQIDTGTAKESILTKEGIRSIIDSRLKLFSDANLTPSEIISAVNQGFGANILGGILGDAKPPSFEIDDIVPNADLVGFEVLDIGILADAIKVATDKTVKVGESFEDAETALLAQAAAAEAAKEVSENAEKVVKETNKIQEKVTKVGKEYKVVLEESLSLNEGLNDAVDATTTAIDTNTISIDANTVRSDIDSKTLQKKINFQKLQILEIAKNINSVAAMTVRVEQVNLAMSKLAIELTEAARRVSTLSISKKGKFTISRRTTDTTFDEIGPLSRQISQQATNVALAERQFQSGFINIDSLSQSLDTLTTLVENAAAGATPSGQAPGAFLVHSGSGTSALIAPGPDGTSQVDINVDGVFDINVQQGGLTQEQILELQEQIGTSLTNAIKNQLGVQT